MKLEAAQLPGLAAAGGGGGEEEGPPAKQGCAVTRDGEAHNRSSTLRRRALTPNRHFRREVLLGSDFESFGFRISLLFSL